MPSSTPIVEVHGVSKRFIMHKDRSLKERIVNFGRSKSFQQDFWALSDVTLDIATGSTVGLIGHNGSGKSTLLKAIGGIIEPSSGSVRRRGRMAALLELGAGFHPDLTGRENVYLNASILGLSRKETDRYFDDIVDFSGIGEFINSQVKFYSSGMYVRLAFAVAVHVDPDLLLVDEVLAVGDEPFQRKCMDKIKEFQREGRTIVLVSHSAEQVGSICDRAVVLDHGRIIFDGDTADGIRALRHGFDVAREEEQEKADPGSDQHRPKILSIKVAGSDSESMSIIGSGEAFDVDFTYELPEDAAEPLALGVGVESAGGQYLFATNTKMFELGIPTTAGTHVVRVSYPHGQPLGAGEFVLRGLLEQVDGTPLDRMNPASTFSLLEPPIGSGAVRVDARMSVLQ